MRWKAPVLSFHCGRIDRELRLAGRGLLLLPSFFCGEGAICLSNPARPPVLVYPIDHRPGGAARTPPRNGTRRSLDALLGRTRAAALGTIAGGCTTGELAVKVGISAASASEHATVLREAGLIETRRRHRNAYHSITRLGATLLGEGWSGAAGAGAAGRNRAADAIGRIAPAHGH